MTDKEIVERAKEAEKRTSFGELVHSPISKGVNSAYGIGFIEGMVEYRNSLPEEPVSEDLNNFAIKYAQDKPYPVAVCQAVKVGAKWQAEQFEKNRLKHCNSITNEQAELEQGFIDQHLDKHQRMPTFLDAIEFGANWQKEQLMKDAVICVVKPSYKKQIGWYLSLDIVINEQDYKVGDRIKVIVIKED